MCLADLTDPFKPVHRVRSRLAEDQIVGFVLREPREVVGFINAESFIF